MRQLLICTALIAGSIAACAIVPEPPVRSLADLAVRRADGSRLPLAQLVWSQSSQSSDTLPEGAIERKELGPALDWLSAHDSDGNGWLTTGELNTAWALLAAWAATGRPWSADSLVDNTGKPVRETGFAEEDSRSLATRISADPATGRLLSEARLRLAIARDRRFSAQKLFFGGWH